MSKPNTSYKLLGCLLRPQNIFIEIGEGDITLGLLIIFLIASVTSTARYQYALKLPLEIPEFYQTTRQRIDPETFKRNIVSFQAFREGLTVFANWLISTLLIHLNTRLLGGKGSFKGMLAKASFASTPQLIQQAIRVADAYTISREELLVLMASPKAPSIFQFFFMLLESLNLFLLWTLMLLTIAASTNYGISRKRAVASTLSTYVTLTLLSLKFYL